MAMAIDAARRDDAALGVDLPPAGAELGADCRDTAVDDPMSARETSDAVASVPLRTTRSYSAMIFWCPFSWISRSARLPIRTARRRPAGGRWHLLSAALRGG